MPVAMPPLVTAFRSSRPDRRRHAAPGAIDSCYATAMRIAATELPEWGAPERNKQPITAQLSRLFVRPGILLEVASGTGQHAAHFAEQLPHLRVQPTDLDPEHLETLRLRAELFSEAQGDASRLLAPLELDASASEWPIERADYVFCANMVHIAPVAAARGLFAGAGRCLAEGGFLVTYGPYREAGQHTAESNASFDASLRALNEYWGVRDVAELEEFAGAAGLALCEKVTLPANNSLLVFVRI